MILFLLFSIPLASLLYLKVYFSNSFHSSETWLVFFRGVISFFISVLPIYIIIRSYPWSYSSPAMYLRSFFLDFLVLVIPLLLFFLLWEKRRIKYEYGQRLFTHIFAFCSGFFALSGVFYGFVYFGHYSGYRLFGFPLLIIMLLLFTVVSLYLYSINMEWDRYLYIAVPIAAGLLFSIVPLLLGLSYPKSGFILCVFYPAVSSAVIYLLQMKRIIPGK